MPKFFKKIPKVLVALSTVEKAYRDKLKGVLKYAHLNGPWDVQTVDTHPFIARLGTLRNWRPDGIIREASKPLPFHIARVGSIPTVLLDSPSAVCRRHSCVNHDSRQTAEAVADAFLRQGLEHFAYVGSIPQSYWSQRRERAFVQRLAKRGCACAVYDPEDVAETKDWGLEQRHMLRWLRTLPTPCGIMAALDLRAKQVLDTCLVGELRVPEDFAVIGVDNDETLCENTTPTLSSVLPDFERGGYLAAELLDRTMRGLQDKPTGLTYGVKQIVHRQSSLRIGNANRLAASAAEFIRINACAGITVLDVVRHLNVSRRLAELRFREACGRSLLDEIQNRRLERVCNLLRETHLPISAIGSRCGYQSELYLKVLFKKRFGTTMRAYRKKS